MSFQYAQVSLAMGKFALLCPGQGAQSAQMFAMANTHPQAAGFVHDVLNKNIAGSRLTDILSQPERLFDNRYAQPLIVAATLANWLAMADSLPQADLVAGYSVGEIAAHAVSGSLDVHAAIDLAAARAMAMQACAEEPHGMLAVSGIRVEDLQGFAARHGLHVAIIIAENKAILAGLTEHIRRAIPQLSLQPGNDVNVTELAVRIASHTPLMQAALPTWAAVLDASHFHAAATGVLAGINGETVNTSAQIYHSLQAQLTHVIQWHVCMDALAEQGVTIALELGPGSALAKMLQARHSHIACRSVADFRGIEGAIKWVERQRERFGF